MNRAAPLPRKRARATRSQFNVLSGGLTDCLGKPWHVDTMVIYTT